MTPWNTRNALCALGAFLSLAAIPLSTAPALGQLSHKGPANAIALSKTLPPYDVVSIKLNKTEANSATMNMTSGRFTATNMPLEAIIEFAYDVKSDQITGLTGPVSSARFDVEAKLLVPEGGTAPKLPDSDFQAMLIPMLADRFHLAVHLMPKTTSVYDLVVAKSGIKIKLVPTDSQDSNWNLNSQDTKKVLSGKNVRMSDLAGALGDEVHREVIDKTGLAGAADITLKWSDDIAAETGGPDVISIFTAIEDQLGLKLQSSKGPVDTLVIDHVEMPTEN